MSEGWSPSTRAHTPHRTARPPAAPPRRERDEELEAYPLNPPTTVVSGADARLKVVVLPAAATEASLDNLFITRLAAKSHSLVVDGAADPIFTSGRHAVSLADAGRRSCLAVSKMSAPRRQFEIST